jgi:hypothetical protein
MKQRSTQRANNAQRASSMLLIERDAAIVMVQSSAAEGPSDA